MKKHTKIYSTIKETQNPVHIEWSDGTEY